MARLLPAAAGGVLLCAALAAAVWAWLPGDRAGPQRHAPPTSSAPPSSATASRAEPAPAARATPPAPNALPRVVTPEDAADAGHALLVGRARIVDGDTLELGARRIRLIGIDAPELHQACHDGAGAAVACGVEAKAVLEAMVRTGTVSCAPVGTDRYHRILARCSEARGEDIGRAIVLTGWALAYDGDPTYAAEEQQALAARRGLHALQYDRPADWRRAHQHHR